MMFYNLVRCKMVAYIETDPLFSYSLDIIYLHDPSVE